MSAWLVGERSFALELPGAPRAEIARQAGGGIPVFPLR